MQPKTEEWRRMLDGEMYDPMDAELVKARLRSQRLSRIYNAIDPGDMDKRQEVLTDWLASFGAKSEVVAPFFCDYGSHVRVGSGVFFNCNCVVLDCAWITIGDRVLMGPGVQLYAATHPLDPASRATGREYALPVTIGSDVWIGGAAIVCPGVTIGGGTTIGAGSVVTRDIPAGVFAAGNPCRVIKDATIREYAPDVDPSSSR